MTVPVHRTYFNVTEQPVHRTGSSVPVHRTYFNVTEQPDDCSSLQYFSVTGAAGWLFQFTERTLMSQISRMTVPVHRTYFSVTEQPDDCSSPHNGLQCHRAAGWLFQSTERTLMSQISRTTVPVRMTVPVHRTYFSVTEQPEDRFSPQYFKCPVRSAALWWCSRPQRF